MDFCQDDSFQCYCTMQINTHKQIFLFYYIKSFKIYHMLIFLTIIIVYWFKYQNIVWSILKWTFAGIARHSIYSRVTAEISLINSPICKELSCLLWVNVNKIWQCHQHIYSWYLNLHLIKTMSISISIIGQHKEALDMWYLPILILTWSSWEEGSLMSPTYLNISIARLDIMMAWSGLASGAPDATIYTSPIVST